MRALVLLAAGCHLVAGCNAVGPVVPQIEAATLLEDGDAVYGGFVLATDPMTDAWISRRTASDEAVFDVVLQGESVDRVTALAAWPSDSLLVVGPAGAGAGFASLDRNGGLRFAVALDLADATLVPSAVARHTETTMVVVGTATTADSSFGFAIELDESGTIRAAHRYDAAGSPVRFDDVAARDRELFVAASVGTAGAERAAVVVLGADFEIRSAEDLGVAAVLHAIGATATGIAIAGTSGADVFAGRVGSSGELVEGVVIDDPQGTATAVDVALGGDEVLVLAAMTGHGFRIAGDTDAGVIAIRDGDATATIVSSRELDRPIEGRASGPSLEILGAIDEVPVRWSLGGSSAGCGQVSEDALITTPTALSSVDLAITTTVLATTERVLSRSDLHVSAPAMLVCSE
jgi:hypothetical protein